MSWRAGLLVAAALPVISTATAQTSVPSLRSLPGGGRSSCCYGLATDKQGNVWFTGSLRSSATLDRFPLESRGNGDVLLARLGPGGRCTWATLAGGGGADHPTGLAVTPVGFAYVVGSFGDDARFGEHFLPSVGRAESFLARYSPDGQCQWAQKLPGQGEDGVRDVAVDPAGSAVVAGTYVRQFSRGDDPEVYVAKFDREGSRLWMRRSEGTGRSLAIAVDDAGVVYLAGSSDAADPGTGRSAAEGWPLVLGFDARGAHRWRWEPTRSSAAEDESAPWGRAVAVAAVPDGGCWVVGEVRGMVRVGDVRLAGIRDRDVFLARLDAGGVLLWAVRVGGPHDDHALGVAAHPSGGCVVAGTFRGTARFEPWQVESTGAEDVFLALYDDAGSCVRVERATGPGVHAQEVLAYEVACDSEGATWAAGWYRGVLRVAGLELAGGRDGTFLTRIPAGHGGP